MCACTGQPCRLHCASLQYNPRFLELVKAAGAEGKAVVLACEAGGTMAASTNFPTGKTSRSLKAAWKVGGWGAWEAVDVQGPAVLLCGMRGCVWDAAGPEVAGRRAKNGV
jgi:hypothetical protein